jgi:hypothetical protein
MSLSWANKFAKSALLNAQKRIDSVLDIKEADEEKEEEEAVEEEQNVSGVSSDHFESTLSDATEVESNSGSVKYDEHNEVCFGVDFVDNSARLVVCYRE